MFVFYSLRQNIYFQTCFPAEFVENLAAAKIMFPSLFCFFTLTGQNCHEVIQTLFSNDSATRPIAFYGIYRMV